MKYIRKGAEPQSFSAWKALSNNEWQPNWENFSKPQKTDVHEALLREQGYICCYCGMRINITSSHIEHFKPRKLFPKIALEYSNLLASCPGEGEERSTEQLPQLLLRSEHCGHQKSEWYNPNLTVSPLQENCAKFFRYTAFGEILPTDDLLMQAAGQETIERLGLNNSKLEATRRRQLQRSLPLLDGLTDAEIQKLAEGFDQLDSNGQYTPFCAAITYILKQYFVI